MLVTGLPQAGDWSDSEIPSHPHFYSAISMAQWGFLLPLWQQMLSKSACQSGHLIQKNAINILAISETLQQMSVLHSSINASPWKTKFVGVRLELLLLWLSVFAEWCLQQHCCAPGPSGTKAICSQEGKIIDHPALIICMHLKLQSEDLIHTSETSYVQMVPV